VEVDGLAASQLSSVLALDVLVVAGVALLLVEVYVQDGRLDLLRDGTRRLAQWLARLGSPVERVELLYLSFGLLLDLVVAVFLDRVELPSILLAIALKNLRRKEVVDVLDQILLLQRGLTRLQFVNECHLLFRADLILTRCLLVVRLLGGQVTVDGVLRCRRKRKFTSLALLATAPASLLRLLLALVAEHLQKQLYYLAVVFLLDQATERADFLKADSKQI